MFYTLLVEDNISFRHTLSEIILSSFPLITVEEAGNEKEVLCKIEYQYPDIIFMDIHLPNVNGLEITRKLKLKFDDIVIVILSGYNLPEYRQQAFHNGADYFLSKEDESCIEHVLTLIERVMNKLPCK